MCAVTGPDDVLNGLRRLIDVRGRDAGARRRQSRRNGPADTPAGAGHQGGLAVQLTGHAMTSPRSMTTACPVMLAAASEARKR